MSPVFAKQTDANKVVPTAGQTLGEVIGGASLEDVGLFNWGTKDHEEIKRSRETLTIQLPAHSFVTVEVKTSNCQQL